MTRIYLSLTTILLILLFSISCTQSPDSVKLFRVIEVIDGDTITIEGGQRVRYIGIDTPEVYPVKEDFGIEALQVNRSLVEGKQVRLERDLSETDRYGRLLRYVYVNDIFVNAELVKEGLAEVYKGKPVAGFDNRPYWDAEQEARKHKRGMWSLGDKYIRPKEWRNGKRND